MTKDKSPPCIFLTGIQWRCFEHLTDEWTPTKDIAQACGYRSGDACHKQLMALRELGFAECQYDGEKRIRMWRRKQNVD